MRPFRSLAMYIHWPGFLFAAGLCQAQGEINFLEEYTFSSPAHDIQELNTIANEFKGYTSHWTEFSFSWYNDGLFLLSQPSPQSERQLAETDIGNQLLLDELWIQDGFVSRMADSDLPLLSDPSKEQLIASLQNSDIIISGTGRTPLVSELMQKIPQNLQYRRNLAFFLQNASRTIFVIASHTQTEADRLTDLIRRAKVIAEKYTLARGLAGVHSNYLLITPGLSHNPYDLINKALQIGCSWMMVSGYNDWMIPGKTNSALHQINFPFTFLPGQYGSGGVMAGMKRYPNIQDNTIEECLDWTEEGDGYYFSYLQNSKAGYHDRYAGYIVTSPADQLKIDSLDTAFLTNAGSIEQNIPPMMILFLEKNQEPTESIIWRTIREKRAVALFEKGRLLGPEHLVAPLKILMLEKKILNEQFDQKISIQAELQLSELNITLSNKSANPISGLLQFQVSPDIRINDYTDPQSIVLAPSEIRTLRFNLDCTTAACGEDLPVGIVFESREKRVRALTHFEVPFPLELHPLIFDRPGMIRYPLTLYNHADQDPTVVIKIYAKQKNEIIFQDQKTVPLKKWEKTRLYFDFLLEAGDYTVSASALGIEKRADISIRNQNGSVKVSEQDIDGDGIPEIIMENAQIKATLLLFGGRIIEYIVKDRNENLLFKLWPQKPPWAGTPRGVRAFYPWGGLEEFTGYPYIGGHIIFNYEIIEASGTRGRVRLWADIHGSKIEKIISLYGEHELLEVRYAMDDIVPSITVIGINPLIKIGPSTGPEDIYYFPSDKLEERRPEAGRYYGDMFFLREGWAAGYDTQMDISLIIGYPVNDAMFLHLWNNHPDNTPTPYYYTELQPWLKIKPRTTTYFSYYLFGQSGDWQAALAKFRELGLVTQVKE